MKKLLLLLFTISILISCKKEMDFKNFKNKIAGSWELEKSVCGECITPATIFPQGNGNIITFSADGAFERRK